MNVRKESAASRALLELCMTHSAAIIHIELGAISRPCCASQITSFDDVA